MQTISSIISEKNTRQLCVQAQHTMFGAETGLWAIGREDAKSILLVPFIIARILNYESYKDPR